MLKAAVCLFGTNSSFPNIFLFQLAGLQAGPAIICLYFMDALVVDLKDFVVRTPEQVFRVFFKLYNAETIKTELWHLFGTWAKALENETSAPGEAEAQVALLFDQLIALTEALENLRNGNTSAISCVVCGNKLENKKAEEPGGQA
jgi:hypothetical protein